MYAKTHTAMSGMDFSHSPNGNRAQTMSILKRLKPFFSIVAILVVVAIAWILRWHAVTALNVDYDEDDYLRAAQQYAALIRSGDWRGFMETNYRQEHPPLAKIIFGFSILPAPEAPLIPDRPTSANPDQSLPREQLRDARTSNAVLGTITVALVALVNPLAGLFLAAHAFTIKYVSQVMLEALPSFTSLAMVLCYLQWKKKGLTKIDGWIIASAIFLGLTAASKYIYCVIGFAVLIDWFLSCREKNRLKDFFPRTLLWGLLAIIIFFTADPYLWPAPLVRLKESVFYHVTYSTGASEVQRANLPFYQSLIYLSTSPAALGWQPEAFPVALDTLILILAAFGLVSLWKKQRLYVLWLGVAFLFLFLWPAKWAQYILILTAPLSLAAAEGLLNLTVRPVQNWLINRKEKTVREHGSRTGDLRRALPWLIPGLLAFAVLTLFPLIFQFGVSLTNFSANSIRDGFHGGLWRAIWGGLTGRIPTAPLSLGGSDQVNYRGLAAYLPEISRIWKNGVLFFNLLWTVLSVLLQAGLGLGVALLIWQRGVRFGKFWQAIFILPWAIPEMIGALMWWNVFEPEWGWLSLAVKTYGSKIPFGFFAGWEQSPILGLLVLLIPAVWYGFPFMMLAVSAGLKMIPLEVFDASAIDGATPWQTFRYVTWPLLLPLIVPALIIRSIFAFNQFYLFQAFGFTNSTLATLSYNTFIKGGQYATSAVINIITVIILIGFVVLLNRRSKIGEGVTYA
ncbi:MAG TPA: ABC transporter permease subunit [Anaerolineales bacterium]